MNSSNEKNKKDSFNLKDSLVSVWKKPAVNSIFSSILSILFGLLFCLIIMMITALVNDNLPFADSFKGFRILLGALFYHGGGEFGSLNMKLVGDMFARATPLILTGLSVGIAYKTGLFNIGAAGQYLAGGVGALLVALTIDTSIIPPTLVWLIALLAGALCGFAAGFIPGLFKALFNVNEVITGIMCNWIIVHIAHWIFEVDYKKGVAGAKFVNLTGATKSNFIYTPLENGVNSPSFGLNKLFSGSQVDCGIVIAIIIAISIFIIMEKTTFGFELKATGKNRHASKYAGMNDKKNIILSMGIAGALAGIGAALWYLNPNHEYNWTVNTALPSEGFNGIPVAFLAFCNPIGTAVSACFMSYINIAGEQVKGAVAINAHISDLIVAVIIYLSAFSNLFKDLLLGKGPFAKWFKKKEPELEVKKNPKEGDKA